MTDKVADTAAWVAAGAAILAVIVYAVQAYFNRRQVKVSQNQVQVSQQQTSVSQQQLWVSQDQVRVSQEQIFVMYRPLLFPFGSDRPRGSAQEVISIRNAGPGTALNIRGVVFGRKPDHSNDKDTCLKKLWFANPLPPGDPPVIALDLQGMPKFRGDRQIGNQRLMSTFYAPERTPEDLKKGMAPIIQRLTLTYHDIYGLKHASIFDRTHLQAWEFVAFLSNIPKDIDDIEQEDAST